MPACRLAVLKLFEEAALLTEPHLFDHASNAMPFNDKIPSG